ncbi:SpoIIE family protein phosphatase [Streptomyces solincola]|uniref:SpoIIE family protein phosphatase n=1 Tax=Streptomyces solincola TaxID=2100817 RepID=UPI00389B28A0
MRAPQPPPAAPVRTPQPDTVPPPARRCADGITETRDHRQGPLFGDERLAATLAATGNLPAADTLDRLHREMTDHTGHHAVDDTALMLLRLYPRP